jgi:threonylcarbamoyladenosine tRNA methylthiotransferase MtaB
MPHKDMTVGILTLGCKVNQYESEAIAEELCRRGYEIISHSLPCSAYVINTCTVTAESDRKARQAIRRMISRNPSAYILVTGCYSQISPDAVALIAGVDYICGSSNKLSVADALDTLASQGRKNASPTICVPELEESQFEPMTITRFDRTRAYVKIEDGCESKCAYCTIPASRGPIRSKPFGDVIDEVRGLVEGGCREIVLTGIETGSYGADLAEGEDLASLLCEIDKLDGIGRVRLGSLDPTVIKPALVDKIAGLSSIAPHFHLSLQSGSDRVLALMKRKYNSRQAMQSIQRLRDAMDGVQFTTDIIVGFPGETEEDFRASCEFVKEAKFLMVHAFPYSKRAGTMAAQMPNQIPEPIKHERVRIISEISTEVRRDILADTVSKGAPVSVLFESSNGGYAYGHTPDFIEVRVKTDETLHGVVRNVKLLAYSCDFCEGIFVND